MSFHAVHPFSKREALCMLPLPLLPSFSALYRCRMSAAFSALRSGASACVSGGTLAPFATFYSSSPSPLRPSSHKMTTPLYPNNCKQWLKADRSLEKRKPKDAGQMSFVVFQLKAHTCTCPQHATFFVLVSFSVMCFLDSASCFHAHASLLLIAFFPAQRGTSAGGSSRGPRSRRSRRMVGMQPRAST